MDTLATHSDVVSTSTIRVHESKESDIKMAPSVADVNYPDPNAELDNKTQENKGPKSEIPGMPTVDRSKKPLDPLSTRFESVALRRVIVPSKVMIQFQTMAQRNTMNNIETCGILAGKLVC
mgnify:FL=1